jgi:hypothetical protein
MFRYTNETKRLWGVLEQRLESNEWLAADEFTIAGVLLDCMQPSQPLYICSRNACDGLARRSTYMIACMSSHTRAIVKVSTCSTYALHGTC